MCLYEPSTEITISICIALYHRATIVWQFVLF